MSGALAAGSRVPVDSAFRSSRRGRLVISRAPRAASSANPTSPGITMRLSATGVAGVMARFAVVVGPDGRFVVVRVAEPAAVVGADGAPPLGDADDDPGEDP